MAKLIPLHTLSSHNRIKSRARWLFQLSGRPDVRAWDHLFRAEWEFKEKLRKKNS